MPKGVTRHCQAEVAEGGRIRRCVLDFGVGGHETRRVYSGALALPVLVHIDEDGERWTFTYQQMMDRNPSK